MKVIFVLALCVCTISGHPRDFDDLEGSGDFNESGSHIDQEDSEEVTQPSTSTTTISSTTNTNIHQNTDSFEIVESKNDNYEWISGESGSKMPDNAVVAGKDYDGAIMYVIRAYHNRKYIIGKYASRGHGYVHNNGVEEGVRSFYFLSAPYHTWVHKSDPGNRVYADKTNKDTYVCRVRYEVTKEYKFNDALGEDTVEHPKTFITIPGYADVDGTCKYSYGYKGYTAEEFEVLVV